MTTSTLNSVRISGLACAVPDTIRSLESEIADADEARKLLKSLGLSSRRVTRSLCASDLCFSAAEALFDAGVCRREAVEAVVFVSQTPDYRLPATGSVLQARLGLPTSVAAFDVNQGCSGYVYGQWLAHSLVASGAASKVLLLVGDTMSRYVSKTDRSVAHLFGDAGSATLLERASARTAVFVLGTDGSGAEHLMVPAGGARTPSSERTRALRDDASGNERSQEHLSMNGAEVFAFTMREVPRLFEQLRQASGWSPDDSDHVVLHQASALVLKHLARKLGLNGARNVVALDGFGNTTSASIPLAMVSQLRERLRSEPTKLELAGFGVGLSWGAMAVELDAIEVPELIVASESQV